MARSEPQPRPADVRIRRLATTQLEPDELTAIRALLDAAFESGDDEERFTDDDWDHALGGVHVVADVDGTIVAHASVVERRIEVGGRPLRTGYVEAVATLPDWQRRGLATQVMRAIADEIAARYELGMLGTAEHGFYGRLGWRTWAGPSSVRMPNGERLTPDEDGYLMVLETPTTPTLDPRAPISCEWRPGDVW